MALLTRTVDIAADMGESFGVWTRGRDEEIAPYLTSAHIACGVHASDPGTLCRTIELLARHGVAIGAHPGYPDLLGFGRRRMDMTPREIEDTVLYQVAVVKGMVEALGSRLQHVKPHGALYHAAEVDDLVAAAIVAATKRFVPPLAIVTTPHSRLFAQAAAAGAPAAREFFLDNAYKADGTLLSRRLPEAVLNDPEAMCRRAVEAVRAGRVAAVDGTMIEVRVDTICLHGDHEPSAVALPKLRVALEAAGVAVRPLGDFVRPPA